MSSYVFWLMICLWIINIVEANFIITINGIEEVAEGDTVNITCAFTGTATPARPIFMISGNPYSYDVSKYFLDSTSNPVIEYNNNTKNYTTTFTVLNVPMDRRFNYKMLDCYNLWSSKRKRILVYCKSKFLVSFLKNVTLIINLMNDCQLQTN